MFYLCSAISWEDITMPDLTYHVVLPFRLDAEGELVAGEAAEAPNAASAVSRAERLALSERDGVCGAVAFSRSGDPATGEFADAIVLKRFGAVPADLIGSL
jgi:hypothetical protein